MVGRSPCHWPGFLGCGTRRPPSEAIAPIGAGEGIHWPDLDEDISIESLLLGRSSGESQASLKRWLEARKTSSQGRTRPIPEYDESELEQAVVRGVGDNYRSGIPALGTSASSWKRRSLVFGRG